MHHVLHLAITLMLIIGEPHHLASGKHYLQNKSKHNHQILETQANDDLILVASCFKLRFELGFEAPQFSR